MGSEGEEPNEGKRYCTGDMIAAIYQRVLGLNDDDDTGQ